MAGDMASAMTRLEAAVTKDRTVNESASTLLGQLSTLLRTNANDPNAINTLADQLDASQQALADAIVANTPAEGTGGTPVGSDQGQTERNTRMRQEQQTQQPTRR